MRKAVFIFLVGVILSAPVFAADTGSVIEGGIDVIEKDYLIMNETQYRLINRFSPEGTRELYGFETEYWVWMYDSAGRPRTYQVDFGTLTGVGWVAHARVTLQQGMVRKIEVLERHR